MIGLIIVVIGSSLTCYGAGLSYNELYTEFQAGAPVTIVDNGVAQFKIVCSVATWSPDDTNPAGLAAYELRDYIQQITGVQLPTSGALPGIYIGDDASPGSWSQSIKDQMEQFGYRILSSSLGIYIAGNPDSYRPDDATANGVNAFMKRIEYITPSGKPLKYLIIIIITPAPTPNMYLPLFVIGVVTGSVAINKAPSNKPPLRR